MLEEFKTDEILIAHANQKITKTFMAKMGDDQGRALKVQITDEGEVVDMTGYSVYLLWAHESGMHKGIETFTAVDATQGVYRIEYPPTMLNHAGTLHAYVQVVDSEGAIINTLTFRIYVQGDEGITSGTEAGDLYETFKDLMRRFEEMIASSGLSIKGSYDTYEDLIQAHPTGTMGDAYIVGNDLYLWTNGEWKNVGRFKGEDGVTPHIGDNGNWFIGETDTGKPSRGIQGERGSQGVQGEQGIQGEKGEQGATGAAGKAATVKVGKVTTGAAGSSVTVTNSGTDNAAVLDFTIPRGEKGEPGDGGVPTEGTAGQVLTKTDTGNEWADLPEVAEPTAARLREIMSVPAVETVNENVVKLKTPDEKPAVLAIDAGGTGAETAAQARGNIGAAAASHKHVKADITDFPASLPASDVSAWAKAATKPTYTANEVGAAPKTHVHSASDISSGTLAADRLGDVPASKLSGIIDSSNLPSYVDDVITATLATFPKTGETGKIYIDQDTNKSYRWSGSGYVEISKSLALGETSATAYRGDHGKAAYDHSQAKGNPHGLTVEGLGAAPKKHTHRAEDVSSGILPPEHGGTGVSSIEELKAAIGAQAVKQKAGVVYSFAGTVVPEGFLPCDGAAVSRTDYAALFAEIGTTYGAGDGSTTFNVPDLGGRVIVGGGSGYAAGQKGGEEKHKLTIDEMPSHGHGTGLPDNNGYPIAFTVNKDTGSSSVARSYTTMVSGADYMLMTAKRSASDFDSNDIGQVRETGKVGGSAEHNNMQPYVVANYIISTGDAVDVNAILQGITTFPLSVEYGGVPMDGAAGQVLTKTAKGHEWADQTGGAAKQPAGIIQAYAGENAPEGYLLCDGSAVSRTTYAELFAAIGDLYGAGDESTTFNVPDFRGRTIVGEGQLSEGSEKFAFTRGNMGGEIKHELTIDEMPSHTHNLHITNGAKVLYNSSGKIKVGSGTGTVVETSLVPTASQTGGGKGHMNMQPFGVANYIISTGK